MFHASHQLGILAGMEHTDNQIRLFLLTDAQLMGGKYRENASVEVACNVPGFDIVDVYKRQIKAEEPK